MTESAIDIGAGQETDRRGAPSLTDRAYKAIEELIVTLQLAPGSFRQQIRKGADSLRSQGVPIYRQEESINAGMGRLRPEVEVVVEERPLAGNAEGDDPLLGAFAQHLNVPLLDVNSLLF